MKHFTHLKSLFVSALFCMGGYTATYAQETGEETPETKTVFTMVNQVTSGNTYVIGIMTPDGEWMAARPPFAFMYPGVGRMSCLNEFKLNDDMQFSLEENLYFPKFVITVDENGALIQSAADGAYISINIPQNVDDGKGDGKDDGKDDGKEPTAEYSFLIDNQMNTDYYWDITYSDEVEGFVMKHKATNVTVGADYADLSTEIDGEFVKNYEWRLAPYVVLPEELKLPIYLFEMQEVESGMISVDADGLNAPMVVYNISGVQVGNSLDNLKAGLYLVKQGKTVKKVLVK